MRTAKVRGNRLTASVPRRRFATAVCVALALLVSSGTVLAQLDPLLFLRRVPPTVIIVMDTGLRMLEDGDGNFYDTMTYVTTGDTAVAAALGLDTTVPLNYRRIYRNLTYENVQDLSTKFEATEITAVSIASPSYATFWDNTRFQIAKRGIDAAVSEASSSAARWGLIKLRQNSPVWRTGSNCDKPVRYTGSSSLLSAASDSYPCNVGGSSGRYGVYTPSVSSPNYLNETSMGGGAEVVEAGPGTASAMLAVVRRPLLDPAGLIPASAGSRSFGDRPLSHALDDAKEAVEDAMEDDSAANRSCRNAVVVLITAGKDDGSSDYRTNHNIGSLATSFRTVTSSGVTKRVPIHVVAIKPIADDETQLRTIASNSGGVYRNVSTSAQVASAINYAVQAGYARPNQFETGSASEYLPVSPVVGTVNLTGGDSATGSSLTADVIKPFENGVEQTDEPPLPQRSNVLLSSGFALPGFEGVLRAFRTYVPVRDDTKPKGWKFIADGTPLWPDLDGNRPEVAGKARVPADPTTRNIYTYIPDGSGGGSVVAFTIANVATLSPHMNTTDASGVITHVRSQPLGAVIGSTPALMDAPSLDPPPDDQYGRPEAASSFAGLYKNRRSMIFVGANDGMIHAIDARTGYEVWAFIPYNLLPKLKTLVDGQSVERFEFFVDSSPKIAEVKINGVWRSLLIIGEGQGGTFYQAFDVTLAGMGVDPDRDGLSDVTALLQQFDTPNESIQFKWAFPNYSSFDPTYQATFAVTDGTPGGQVRMYGDLMSTASFAEKTVGFTWSDPAVGPLDQARSTNAIIVGSGYFPNIETLIPARGESAPRAGNALYLLDADTGVLLGNASGTTCPEIRSGSGSGNGCVSIGDVSTNGRKNAIQADPTAAGLVSSTVVTKAYVGDLDGTYWRFDITASGGLSAMEMIDTSQPIYSSSALLFVGSADVYMFFATGSDLLPSSSDGGTGTFKLYGLKDNAPGPGATQKFSIPLATVTNSSGLATGERPSTAPSVAGDIVFYSTTTESASSPCSDYSANIYAVTYVGGAAYDANNTGRIESDESRIVRTIAGRATAPFIVDQHLYVGAAGATGANIEAFGDPEDFNNGIGQVGVRILSWREIR